MSRVRSSVPVVGGLAYREALAQTPRDFTATLKPEPENPFNPGAIAVYGPSGKVGYVSPEIARHCYQQVLETSQATCPARKAAPASRTTGVEARVDLSGILPEGV